MFIFDTQSALEQWARLVGQACTQPCVIYLQGDLGVGKTTWMRAFLEGAGIQGVIRSPTYTLVETYMTETGYYAHADLYRLEAPSALEGLDLRAMVGNCILGIEWPEKGGRYTPVADFSIRLQIAAAEKRILEVQAFTELGNQYMALLSSLYEENKCSGSNDSPLN